MRVLAAVLLMAALGACAAPRPERVSYGPEADAGHAFVARACAGCHAVGETGRSTDPASPPFRVLAQTRSPEQLRSALEAVAQHGHVQMPPIYSTPDERDHILRYLAALKRRTSPHT